MLFAARRKQAEQNSADSSQSEDRQQNYSSSWEHHFKSYSSARPRRLRRHVPGAKWRVKRRR